MDGMYLDAVRLDGDEAGERVSQWFWWDTEVISDCLRLLVGRHCDVYVMVDEESKGKQQLGFSLIKSVPTASTRGTAGGAGLPACSAQNRRL